MGPSPAVPAGQTGASSKSGCQIYCEQLFPRTRYHDKNPRRTEAGTIKDQKKAKQVSVATQGITPTSCYSNKHATEAQKNNATHAF